MDSIAQPGAEVNTLQRQKRHRGSSRKGDALNKGHNCRLASQ
jgi:hypothetical protein